MYDMIPSTAYQEVSRSGYYRQRVEEVIHGWLEAERLEDLGRVYSDVLSSQVYYCIRDNGQSRPDPRSTDQPTDPRGSLSKTLSKPKMVLCMPLFLIH